MKRSRLGLHAAMLGAALSSAAAVSASEQQLALEVVMNGRPTGRVGAFIERDGALYAMPDELRDMGFVVPRDFAAASEPIPLARLPNMHEQVDEVAQTLIVEASDAAQVPVLLGSAAPPMQLAPLSPPSFGAVFNYDMLGTYGGRQTAGGQQSTGGALLDLRAFGPYGVLENSGLVNISPYPGQAAMLRLGTTFTYAEPDNLRRWRAGDVVSGALSWSRAVRLGGIQLRSDFTLRPDLVTYPLPTLSASAAVPSTVEVMVDGIRQFAEPVQPGPFAVRTLPVVTGAGEIAVTVQDALGRQTLVTLPFYTSTTLLKPGLASYSVEAGSVRQNFGLATDRYAGAAMSASLRYGLADWLTGESHAEATPAMVLLGGGAALRLGSFGVVNAAVSGSSTFGGIPGGTGSNTGGMAAAGFQRLSHGLSFSLNGSVASSGYRDIAAMNGTPVPRSTLNVSLGYQLGQLGNIGIGYVHQGSRSLPPGWPVSAVASSLIANSQISLATLSYSVPIVGSASLYVTGFKDLRNNQSYGVAFGIGFGLGPTMSASAGASLDSGRAASALTLTKPALEENQFGFRLQDSEGTAAQHLAIGEYLSPWGRATAGVEQSSGQRSVQGGWSGSLVWTDGRLFASNQIDDAFAVVSTGGVAGVPVLYQNRLVGTTDSSGHLLVPSLLSYQNNPVAVDTTRLSPDIDVGQTTAVVRPPDRAGVVIDFAIRKADAALLTLLDRNGKPLPVGSVAKVPGAPDQPVGFDGLAYVTGLQPANRVQVVAPNGANCTVEFAYAPVQDDIPLIGPLRCQ